MNSSNTSQCVEQKSNECEDKISNLPICILTHILSLLPTIDAVRTCVLSKRWIYHWTNITDLRFDYDNFHFRNSFQNFVSSVLLHLTNSTIQSFSLNATDVDPSHLVTWISSISKRRVKNLTISYHRDLTTFSSLYIFCCKSLVHLILKTDCVVKVPNFVHLPNLQTLELLQAKLTKKQTIVIKDIVFNLPVLRKFKAVEISWLDVESVSFEVPLLETVDIERPSSHSSSNCLIKLCTSRLTYFSYVGNPSQHVHYAISSEPSSDDINFSASIKFSGLHGPRHKRIQWCLQACSLLKQWNLSKVKHLELSFPEVLTYAKQAFEELPTFNKMKHLKLGKISGEMLIVFLLKSPYLTSLTIEMVDEVACDVAEKLLNFDIVPDCICTLETLRIDSFCGQEHQLSLVKYMTDNAEDLEKISFSLSPGMSNSRMEEIKESISSFNEDFALTSSV